MNVTERINNLCVENHCTVTLKFDRDAVSILVNCKSIEHLSLPPDCSDSTLINGIKDAIRRANGDKYDIWYFA